MLDITYETMCASLAESVLELNEAYAEEVRRWPEVVELPHVVYGNLLNPLLVSLLLEDDTEARLQPIYAFLEVLATSKDDQVRNVLAVTVLEGILGHGGRPAWDRARPYMGRATAEIGAKVERHFFDGTLLESI